MDIAEKIYQAIKNRLPLVCDFGIVTSVDENNLTCDVEIEGKSPVLGVRLFCGNIEEDPKGGGIVIIPEIDSQVVIVFMSTTVAFLMQCSKAKKIVFNGGEFGGMIKIQELIDSINSMKDYVEKLKNAISSGFGSIGEGSAASGSAAKISFESNMTGVNIDIKDFEDKNIEH